VQNNLLPVCRTKPYHNTSIQGRLYLPSYMLSCYLSICCVYLEWNGSVQWSRFLSRQTPKTRKMTKKKKKRKKMNT